MIIEVKGIGHIDLLSVVVVQPVMGDTKTNIDYYYVSLLGGHVIRVYESIYKRDLFINEWVKAKALQHSLIN